METVSPNPESPEVKPENSDLARLNQYLSEVEMVKVVTLRAFYDASTAEEPDGAKEAARLSPAVLKSIEVQLRIMAEKWKRAEAAPELPEALEDLWRVMLKVPVLYPVLRRDKVRGMLVAALREEAAADDDPYSTVQLQD